jgi:glutamate/tyrosine decarboxylase-like PLP-dependent enzyme
MLGSPVTVDYSGARQRRILEEPATLEAVTAELVRYLSGMFIWGHPRAQMNVVPSPTIPSIIAGLLPSIYNPNLVSEEASRQVSLAEVEAIAMTAALVGYDPETADGVLGWRSRRPSCAPTAPTTPASPWRTGWGSAKSS